MPGAELLVLMRRTGWLWHVATYFIFISFDLIFFFVSELDPLILTPGKNTETAAALYRTIQNKGQHEHDD